MIKILMCIIVAVIIIIYLSSVLNKKEHFYWNPLNVGKTHSDCYRLKGNGCLKYSNCGLCLKDGEVSCIPGDDFGPFFKEDCMGWVNTNIYDSHIFNDERVLRGYPPWNMFYPTYEARYPSPIARSSLL